MRYTFTNKKVLVIEIPEWKLKTELARSTMFEGNYDKLFAYFGSKIVKTTLVSQSLSHILGNK